MDTPIFAGIIIAAGLVVFALVYSRSNATHRSRAANGESTSTVASDTSSSYDPGSSANCADGSSSCDGGGGGGGD